MNPIKLRRLKKLVEQVAPYDKSLAHELSVLIHSIENPPHPGKRVLESSLAEAIHRVQKQIGDIEYCLIGGSAVQYWVDTRQTGDVDLLVINADLNKIREAFPDGKNSVFSYSFHVEGIPFQVFDGEHFPWAAESVAEAKHYEFRGASTRVATPEYLVLFKLVAARDRDVADILALLTLPGVASSAKELVFKYCPTELEVIGQLIGRAELGLL